MPDQSHSIARSFERPETSTKADRADPQSLSRYPDAEFVVRFLAGMPVDVAASFSARQLFAIQQAFGLCDGQEPRDGWHGSLRMPWATYSMSLKRERR